MRRSVCFIPQNLLQPSFDKYKIIACLHDTDEYVPQTKESRLIWQLDGTYNNGLSFHISSTLLHVKGVRRHNVREENNRKRDDSLCLAFRVYFCDTRQGKQPHLARIL